MKSGADARKVIILDRDGTIVIDRKYLSDPADLELTPGAGEALRCLHADGYRLVVITNQSGVGRGFFSVERMHEVHDRLRDMVREAGAELEAIYYCPHVPEDECGCRKPDVGLLFKAAAELGFDPSGAIVIGDKMSDVEFGQRAGATTILVGNSAIGRETRVTPDFIVRDLAHAQQFVMGQIG